MSNLEDRKPMRLSASKIKTWMACPLQAKFHYIDKLPVTGRTSSGAFGNVIHNALKVYNLTNDVEHAISVFVETWEKPELIGAEFDVYNKRTSYGSYRERGIGMLRGYHDRMKWENRTVLAVEHEFLVPFGDFELHGFVDLVELRKGDQGDLELRVVDYKTNTRQPYKDTLQWDVQFTTYVYAVGQPEFWFGLAQGAYEQVKDLPTRAYWYQLKDSREIHCGIREDEDYMRLYRVAKEIEKAQNLGVYVPNLSGDSCTFCAYKEPCGLPVLKGIDVD